MKVEKIVTVIVTDVLMKDDEAVKEEPVAKIFAEVAAGTEIAEEEGVAAGVMKGLENQTGGIVDVTETEEEEIENHAVER